MFKFQEVVELRRFFRQVGLSIKFDFYFDFEFKFSLNRILNFDFDRLQRFS